MNRDLKVLSRMSSVRDFLLVSGLTVQTPSPISELAVQGATKGQVVELLTRYFSGFVRTNHGYIGYDFLDLSPNGEGYVTITLQAENFSPIFQTGSTIIHLAFSWTNWK